MNAILPSLFLAISIIILPFMSHAASAGIKSDKENHRAPKSYVESVKTLESVQHELKELTRSYRL